MSSRLSRRGFLKRLGVGLSAIIVGKKVLKANDANVVQTRLNEIRDDLRRRRGFRTNVPLSARGVLESLPDISAREIALIKLSKEAGKLYDISVNRNPRQVSYPEKIADEARSFIHQHSFGVLGEDELHYAHPGAIPDMANYFKSIIKIGKANVRHVVTVSKEGKVMGYFSVHATKKLLSDLNKLHEYNLKIHKFEDAPTGLTQADAARYYSLLLEMNQKGYLQIKIRSMPKYVFKGLTFVPK
ncbi:MAG: hypothetical protein WCI04_00705 [archaeon]